MSTNEQTAVMIIEEITIRNIQIDYWKERCILAEKLIDRLTFIPDETTQSEAYQAYKKWIDFVISNQKAINKTGKPL